MPTNKCKQNLVYMYIAMYANITCTIVTYLKHDVID